MADKQPTTKGPALPGFQRLNHKTYLYDPATSNSNGAAVEPTAASLAPRTTGTPGLILLCSWMDASLRHVAKYTTYYQALYPATPILLVTCATNDFFFSTAARQKRELAPALAAICSYCPATTINGSGNNSSNSSTADGGGLFVHALSNGGCGHLAMICGQYRLLTGAPLPARAVVYDSAPGRSRFKQGFAAMSMALPSFPLVRWPLQAFIAALLVVFFHLPPLLGVQTLSMQMRDVLNDPDHLAPAAPRTYAFSAADAIILAADVEEHAAEAEGAKGLSVRRVVFEGSPHVGHMRQEPERYWEMVAMAWEKRA
ncbi:putative duf829 domain protein [Neofusicoccum parvum UCRNP2]|uniref:Putative duf829 domain protein n=1 Tax=Botryosphaeria parva (strain UCR-NP2) TaxID=1287680 RepID=R1G926_BOTPV|nr:putative duf829 domain protein [Neofusicoccum parvum UCRNP2]